MVARTFDWDTAHVFATLGWKAAVAVALNAVAVGLFVLRDLRPPCAGDRSDGGPAAPWWLTVVHAGLIGLVVCWAHHPKLVLGVLVLFIGVATVTRRYHDPLHLRHGLMVGGFLSGLVVLGSHSGWWIGAAVTALDETGLYFAATAMTAITDNAALTYLGTQVPLTDGMRYALVAGSVTGGGLTVIANAPNPAGAAILQPTFNSHRISPLYLLLGASGPTIVVIVCFQVLPDL
jgi:hypothetical protein